MGTAKKITTIIPEDLIKSAQKVTGQGITQTIKTALQLLSKKESYKEFKALKGTYKSKLDISRLREDE